MMGTEPLVTIVTPSYNSEKYINENILSIKKQTYDNIEHIVVDGNSCDETVDILRDHENDYNLKWVSESDSGMYDAIEKGFSMASGSIYAWINSDDKYLPWAVELAVKSLIETPHDWIIGHPAKWDQNGNLVYVTPLRPYYNQGWIRNGWYHGNGLGWLQQESMFWSAELWESRGGFPDKINFAGDYYLWREFAKDSELKQIGTVISGFRKHNGQKTSDMDQYYREVPDIGIAPKIMNKLRINDIYSLVKGLQDAVF